MTTRCGWTRTSFARGEWVQLPCFNEATWIGDYDRRETPLCSSHKGVAGRHWPDATFTRLTDWMLQRRRP